MFQKGQQYKSSAQFKDYFSQGVKRLLEKLQKWKAGLTHSDLVATDSPGLCEPMLEPSSMTEDEDEEPPQLNTYQLTEGHCEFFGGELCMVNDEEMRSRQEEGGVSNDEDD